MRRALVFTYMLSGLFLSATAQESNRRPAQLCAANHINRAKPQLKTTVADLREDNYDIKHVRFNLELSNISNFVIGDVTTTATVVADSLPQYVFELASYMIVDSFKLNGQILPVTGSGVVRTVAVPAPLQQGSSFTAQVYYHGQPPFAPGFFSYGIRNDFSPSWGTQVTYTLSQPYDAKDWWPIKQSLTDKIDSVEAWFTVPDTCKAGSNGLLQAVTTIPGGKLRYEWKTRNPIDYYLISAAVAPYVDYSYYIHFPGSNDSMLYQNYIYNNPNTLPFWKDEIDSVAEMILHFSDLFGRYPFWEEKYGHSMAPLSGGMEHQTMTTQGFFSTTLSAHELGHQWFGDHVTCATWKDIWLNEGFASYCEYLFVHEFHGPADAFNYMEDVHLNVRSDPGGTVYVDDTSNEGRIFDARLSYDKGSAIVHTLRFVFNNDSLFYATLRNYQQTFGDSTATTAAFEQFCETSLGQNLDTFFQQWIYKEGYPLYHARWNQIDSQVIVKLTQLTSLPSSQTLFRTPLELELRALQGDTIVKVYNNQNVQTFTFTWKKQMNGMSVDPNNWIVDTTLSIIKDVTLDVGDTDQQLVYVAPNPAIEAWTVTGVLNGSEAMLYDLQGRLLWKASVNGSATIPATGLAPGMYLLRVSRGEKTTSVKLLKN